jgi:hypothetical protein
MVVVVVVEEEEEEEEEDKGTLKTYVVEATRPCEFRPFIIEVDVDAHLGHCVRDCTIINSRRVL